MRQARPILFRAVLVFASGGVAVLGGCGYSAAQEYQRIHSIVVAAKPGDGSVIASAGPTGLGPDLARAIASADRGRNHASDSVTVVGD